MTLYLPDFNALATKLDLTVLSPDENQTAI